MDEHLTLDHLSYEVGLTAYSNFDLYRGMRIHAKTEDGRMVAPRTRFPATNAIAATGSAGSRRFASPSRVPARSRGRVGTYFLRYCATRNGVQFFPSSDISIRNPHVPPPGNVYT